VIETQLAPLVYSEAENAKYPLCDEKSHPGLIIQNLSDLLTNLEKRCNKALDFSVLSQQKIPLPRLIEEKLKFERQKSADCDVDDLNKVVKDLRKQLREMNKLKGENERLKNVVEKQKDKIKDYNKMVRDTRRYKQDMEKYKREAETLKYEIETLKDQLRSNVCIVNQYTWCVSLTSILDVYR